MGSPRRARALTSVLALTVVVAFAASAQAAAPTYISVDLGATGGTSSTATAINDAGLVVGQANWHSHGLRAVTWTEATGFTPPPILWDGMFTAVSPNGHLAGTMQVYVLNDELARSGPHAFAWSSQSDPAPVDIGSLGGGIAHAWGVNDAGEIVGDSSADLMNGNDARAFSWTPAGGIVALATLGGNQGEAAAVNTSGTIAGWSSSLVNQHACVWTHAGAIIDLGSLAGPLGRSMATAISDSGQVVGFSQVSTSSNDTHAFSWTQAGGMIDLGVLPGSTTSSATAVSSTGQVVGTVSTQLGLGGFTWSQSTGMSGLSGIGGTDVIPRGVNASGRIVGDSTSSDGHHQHAVIWRTAESTPVAPSTPELTLPFPDATPGLAIIASHGVSLSGTAERAELVTLYRDGVAVASRQSDPDTGRFDIPDSVPADGTYAYSAKVTDAAGRDSVRGGSFAVTVDQTGPALVINGPATGVYGLASIPARPTFSASDPIGVKSQVDAWTGPSSITGAGVYVYTATALDWLDNQTRETRTYTVQYGSDFAGKRGAATTYTLGHTIPVRFPASGDGIVASLWVARGATGHGATALSTPSTRLHYDPAAKQYTFDLPTDRAYVNPDGMRLAGFAEGAYTLTVALDDDTVRTLHVKLAARPLTLGQATTSVRRPRAGMPFALTFALTRHGATRALANVGVTLVVRVGTRLIRPSATFRKGKVLVSLRVPSHTRGKRLTLRLTVREGGANVSRTASFKVV